MAETIHEAVVRLKPEGADETQTALEDATGQFESSTDEMQEQTAIMDKFSEKFQGAMQVAIAGLTIAAAGLASKVPVLGEAFAGLNAILTAVGMKVDGVLRPALSPVADLFFDIASAITKMEGPAGTLVGIAGTIVLALGSIAAAAATVGGAMGGVEGAIAGVKWVFSSLWSIGVRVVSWLASLVSGSLAAAAAFGALVGAFTVGLMEVFGINDAIKGLGDMLANGLPKWANTGLVAVMSIFLGILATIGAAILGFVQGFLEGGLSEGLAQAVERTKEMLGVFLWAWRDVLDRVGSFAKGAANWILGVMADLTDGLVNMANEALSLIESAINDAVEMANEVPGVSFSKVSVGKVGSGVGQSPTITRKGAATGSGGQSQSGINQQIGALVSAMQNNEMEIPINIDGREVARSQANYLGEGTANRGRTGE